MNLLPKKKKLVDCTCLLDEHFTDAPCELHAYNNTLSDCKQSLIKGLEGMKVEWKGATEDYYWNRTISAIIKELGGSDG